MTGNGTGVHQLKRGDLDCRRLSLVDDTHILFLSTCASTSTGRLTGTTMSTGCSGVTAVLTA